MRAHKALSGCSKLPTQNSWQPKEEVWIIMISLFAVREVNQINSSVGLMCQGYRSMFSIFLHKTMSEKECSEAALFPYQFRICVECDDKSSGVTRKSDSYVCVFFLTMPFVKCTFLPFGYPLAKFSFFTFIDQYF